MRRIRTVAIASALLGFSGAASAQEIRENPAVAVVVQSQEARQAPAAIAPDGKRLLGYSIVLLLGDIEGTTVANGLSAPARKALGDIKDFLPYKSYRVLDTQWLASVEETGGGDRRNSGRLRGPDDQEYLFELWLLGGRPNTRAFRLLVPPPNPQQLVDTTFDIHVGETVVVGTSRLQGNKALIVLLTAVPR